MENVHVPVAEALPVGRLEWAKVGETLYGVDTIGQTFIIKPAMPATDDAAGYARLLANLLGYASGAARPRYRRRSDRYNDEQAM